MINGTRDPEASYITKATATAEILKLAEALFSGLDDFIPPSDPHLHPSVTTYSFLKT